MKIPLYIFGAGKNGKKLFEVLRNNGIKVTAFIDNDEKKQKEEGYIECISVEEAVRKQATESIVLISPNESSEIKRQLDAYNFCNIFDASKWIRFIPNSLEKSYYRYVHPFDHYESPYPDILEIHKKEKELFNKNKDVLDIDFNLKRQLELLKEMEDIELPEWGNEKDDNSEYRYFYNNGWFGKAESNALYYMMRILHPQNIIEIGSGYSTAVMLDTNENYFKNKIRIYSIEPRIERLKKLLKPSDNLSIYEKDLQDIPVSFFEKLGKNDILFVDSSHVSRMNSDVNYLFFEILPRLKNGVYIHFHDIFYPFIYPKDWIYEGRAYTEMYILRAFLMNNKKYSIQLFGDMIKHNYNDNYKDKIAKKLRDCGTGSLWIKKEELGGYTSL